MSQITDGRLTKPLRTIQKIWMRLENLYKAWFPPSKGQSLLPSSFLANKNKQTKTASQVKEVS